MELMRCISSTIVLNEMRSLEKTYSTCDRIRKIFNFVSSVWRPMVTTITQAKDLIIVTVEEIILLLRKLPYKKVSIIRRGGSTSDIW